MVENTAEYIVVFWQGNWLRCCVLPKKPRLAVKRQTARQVSWLMTAAIAGKLFTLPGNLGIQWDTEQQRHLQLRGQPKYFTSFPFNPISGTVLWARA